MESWKWRSIGVSFERYEFFFAGLYEPVERGNIIKIVSIPMCPILTRAGRYVLISRLSWKDQSLGCNPISVCGQTVLTPRVCSGLKMETQHQHLQQFDLSVHVSDSLHTITPVTLALDSGRYINAGITSYYRPLWVCNFQNSTVWKKGRF